ncbi:hypothetical protein KRP22_007326 [Phytophthora ramorum]|nr:hypothetical protein KRP22_4663 [Phytophthora ramorum]
MDSRRTAPDRTTPVRVLRVVDLARGHLGHRQSIGCLRGHADNFAQRLLDAQLCKLMLTFHLHGCRATTQHESRRQQQVEGVHRRGMRWSTYSDTFPPHQDGSKVMRASTFVDLVALPARCASSKPYLRKICCKIRQQRFTCTSLDRRLLDLVEFGLPSRKINIEDVAHGDVAL